MSVTSKLTDMVEKEVNRLGFLLVDLKYGKTGPEWSLRIFVDRPGGITIDECSFISRELGYELDRYPDLIKHAYRLEISSPGLDRKLRSYREFKACEGRRVIIEIKGSTNIYTGLLKRVNREYMVLEADSGEIRIELNDQVTGKLEVKI